MRISVTYYLDVISSWCFWAEPAWAELKRRYHDKVEFQWKIGLLFPMPACARENDSPSGRLPRRLERRRAISMQKNCSNGRVRPWLKRASAPILLIFICCK